MTSTDTPTSDQVKDRAADVAGQAQEKAQQAAGQARDQVRTQIDQRSTDAGRRVNEQGSDLRAVGDQLREQGKDGPAKLADQAANQVEKAGNWLTESDADKILSDIENAARKNPWAVAASGLALGFAASRFLKASSSERYRSSSLSSGRQSQLPRLPQPGGTRQVGDYGDYPTSTPGIATQATPRTGVPPTPGVR
jgi:hypothetical protein